MVDAELVEVLSDWKEELKSDMNSMYTELKKDINSINERLQSVENICTVIEKEHGEKLDLLLDYASANIEKHEEYDKKLEHFDNKFFDHDVRIGIIESSDWYKKMVKGKGNSSLSRHALS